MLITSKQAAGLVIIDPFSGKEIPHVASVETEKGWVETYMTTACVPNCGMEMWYTREGKTEALPYTFLKCTDPATGGSYYPTREHPCAFDVVDKKTGEVIHECNPEGSQAPERVRTPWVPAEEARGILAHP